MATEVTNDDIATAALEPKRMKGDQSEVEQRSVDELMKAADRVNNNTASALSHGGLYFNRIKPGGAV